MSNLQRDIASDSIKITHLIDYLSKDEYLIPTFQRDFVWQPENIRKLWDSIFRFYPIGSLLCWETQSYLHTHRRLGGVVLPHDEETVKKFNYWKYILDGQQRATALLVSFCGGEGRINGNVDFDYTMYFDVKTGEFFFISDYSKRSANTDSNFLIRLRDVPKLGLAQLRKMLDVPGFDETVQHNLEQLQKIFTDYKVALIRIKGVEVSEVVEIFERINQEGKKLHAVDIIVARTYRSPNETKGVKGFYLRDNLKTFRELLIEKGNRFKDMDDLQVVQMFALCLRKQNTTTRSGYGITPGALNNLKATDFECHWEEVRKTILSTVGLLSSLRIHGPEMLPYNYMMLALCYYLHSNKHANKSIARQWFWRTAFGVADFRNANELYDVCDEFFGRIEKGEKAAIAPLVISRQKLIHTSYNHRNAVSRAVLAFLANQNPRDFSDPQADVLDNVYLLLTQAPNLHHIFPLNFLKGVGSLPENADPNSLMNVCFLKALTNIHIGDKNPLVYLQRFKDRVPDFDKILESHLIPAEFINQEPFQPSVYEAFLKARADRFAGKLKQALPDVEVTISE